MVKFPRVLAHGDEVLLYFSPPASSLSFVTHASQWSEPRNNDMALTTVGRPTRLREPAHTSLDPAAPAKCARTQRGVCTLSISDVQEEQGAKRVSRQDEFDRVLHTVQYATAPTQSNGALENQPPIRTCILSPDSTQVLQSRTTRPANTSLVRSTSAPFHIRRSYRDEPHQLGT